MAKLNESSELSLKEEALDEEDELDGWGPVRVRRSTIPAPSASPRCAERAAPATQNGQPDPKRLMT